MVSIPRAYKRNTQTKLLWLYKTSIISYIQYCNASKKLATMEQLKDLVRKEV